MSLLADLIDNITEYPVKEVVIGVFNTLVWTRNCGLSATLKSDVFPHERVKNSGALTSMNVREVAGYVFSENPLEVSVGMAAINSALPVEREKFKSINAKELILKKGKMKVVGVIGHFPFLEEVRDEFRELYIFEKMPRAGDLREEDIPEYLPACDVVAITGTAIANKSFEEIVKWTRRRSYVIVLGPTTPLSSILFDYGVDAICGTLVLDIPLVLNQVKEGTPFKDMKGIQYVALLREEYFG